jgi:hypothetical protein
MFGLIAIPFCCYHYGKLWKSSLAEKLQRSVCPVCDHFDHGLSGVSCLCGGVNVAASTVEWIDNTSEVRSELSHDI